MRPNRLLRFVGVLFRTALPIGILAAGWAAYSQLSVEAEKTNAPPAEKQILRTKVTELRSQDYKVVIKTHGVVQPHNQAVISPQVSGKIVHISPSFEAGAYFSQGDVLVELDAKEYETAVAVAKALHQGAESALVLAKLNKERKARLLASNAVSQAEVDTAEANYEQAEASVASAAAQLQQAELALARTKIRAPFDGRVRQRDVGLGQTVGPSAPLGIVFGVDFAEVRLPISGRQLQFLSLPEDDDDPPVEVELRDAINESTSDIWSARIIRTEGVLDENSRELFAVARVDDPFGRKSERPPLRIGQPVVASIDGKVLSDVVALPRVAVRQLDQINLVVNPDLTLLPKKIDPIWSDDQYVIVRDPDIRDGMLLSTTHLVYAPSGTKVEIIPDIEPRTAVPKSDAAAKSEPVAN